MRKTLNRILSPLGYEISKVRQRSGTSERSHYLTDIRRFINGNDELLLCDVGANTGATVGDFVAEFPRASIFAFEPSPEAFAGLNKLASERTHPIQCALSDCVGEATLYTYLRSGLNSLLPLSQEALLWKSKNHNLEQIAEIRVPVDTLDNFCAHRSISKIDILKIDTQGNDLKVLRGAENMVNSERIRWIYVEMNFVHIYDGQSYFHDLYNALIEKNYTLFNFYDWKLSPEGRLKWLNGLFALRSALDS